MSNSLLGLKDFQKAEKVKRQQIERLRNLELEKNPEISEFYSSAIVNLGYILSEQGKFKEAEEEYRKAITYREKVFGASSKIVAAGLIELGDLYLKQNKIPEAEAVSEKAIEILGEALENGETDEQTILDSSKVLRNFARINFEKKNYAKAIEDYKHVILLIEGKFGLKNQMLVIPLEEYGKMLRDAKHFVEAKKIEARLQLLKKQNQ